MMTGNIRSSHRRYSVKKVFLKISQISQENTCAGLFLNKAAALQACNLIKKRLQHRCFPVKFAKFLRRPIWRTSANDWSKDMSIINANINVHIFLHENDVIFRWPYQFYDFGTVYLSFYLANCKKLAESSKLLNWLNS